MQFTGAGQLRTFFLVLDRGDEVIAALRRFADEQGIRGGRFAAIGAFESFTISWWNWETKQYEKHDIDEQVEVTSLIGDISRFNGDTVIHAHVNLGRRDLTTHAGHLFRGVVRPTLEVHLVDYGIELVRARDEASGLPLIELH
jgi:uncharacterized protein